MKNTFKIFYGLLIFLMTSFVGFASASVEPTSSDHDVGWQTVSVSDYHQALTGDLITENSRISDFVPVQDRNYFEDIQAKAKAESTMKMADYWPGGDSKSDSKTFQSFSYEKYTTRFNSLKYGKGFKRLSRG